MWSDTGPVPALADIADRINPNIRVRPSVQVARSCPWTDAVALDGTGQLRNDIHEAINHLLGALDEPKLEEMQAESPSRGPKVRQ